jgi:nucleoside phosphorylase
MAPTPLERAGLERHVSGLIFKRLDVSIRESGAGKINAALSLAAAITALPKGGGPGPIVMGAGTSGSLSLHVHAGEVIFSLDSVIADWRHDDGKEQQVGAYGAFDYGPPDPERVEGMSIRSSSPVLAALQGELSGRGFTPGRVLTSDSFIASREYKLSLGGTYGALVCDMESGAFAWTARRLGGLDWLNLRVAADTLDETLSDYFEKEKDVTEALGDRAAEALKALDGILE